MPGRGFSKRRVPNKGVVRNQVTEINARRTAIHKRQAEVLRTLKTAKGNDARALIAEKDFLKNELGRLNRARKNTLGQ